MGDVTPVTGSPDRRRIRGERSRRAVAAAVAVAREHGLRVEEPTVLADLLSVMVRPRTGHRPDPEVLARCTELRTLQVVLCLIALYDVFGDLEGWGRRHPEHAHHARVRVPTGGRAVAGSRRRAPPRAPAYDRAATTSQRAMKLTIYS
jgi:hypothetical protein